MGADFVKLWSALSISLMGSAITTLALPLPIGSAIGVRATLFVFAVGMVAAPLAGVLTALRGVREQPVDVDEEGSPAAAPPVPTAAERAAVSTGLTSSKEEAYGRHSLLGR